MKIIFLISILLTNLAINCTSQSNYALPKGYSIYSDYNKKAFRIDKDFDGDGIKDLVIVYSKNNTEGENIIAVYLSTAANGKFYSFPFSSLSYNLEYKNNVLTIGSCFGNGRYCKTLKFKYYPVLKNMRLIGYEEESFGNAVHEGAYLKSINLLINKYEMSGPKWKNKIIKREVFPSLTLENMDEKKLEYLENIGSRYFH